MGLDHVLVAGGGSGGHVFPALPVVRELSERGCRVSWLGRSEGMERALVEERDIPYFALPAAAVVGRGPVGRAQALARTAVSAVRARGLVRRQRVDAVLGTGGYVSAPGVLGARLAGRPSLLLEPNATSGTANRWLSRWASAAAVASQPGARDLRCRLIPVGVPVRREFHGEFEPPGATDAPRVLVLGGSQGARQINRLLPAALARVVGEHPGLQVTHQVGGDHVDETRQAYADSGLTDSRVEVVPFISDVAAALRRSHLVVSRAGAITLAEICAIGRAAVLIPLGLAGSHQVANARRVVATGGARMFTGDDFGAVEISLELIRLLADRRLLAQMGAACRILYAPAAATRIANELASLVGDA